MTFEILEHQGRLLAEVLFRDAENASTKFYSRSESAMQVGLMSHKAGFVESAHSHPEIDRERTSTQQAFVVIYGRILVDFFEVNGTLIRTFELVAGDTILIVDGIHRIRVLENSKCVTIKQGPFHATLDKIEASF